MSHPVYLLQYLRYLQCNLLRYLQWSKDKEWCNLLRYLQFYTLHFTIYNIDNATCWDIYNGATCWDIYNFTFYYFQFIIFTMQPVEIFSMIKTYSDPGANLPKCDDSRRRSSHLHWSRSGSFFLNLNLNWSHLDSFLISI